jgi:hypothetical protein
VLQYFFGREEPARIIVTDDIIDQIADPELRQMAEMISGVVDGRLFVRAIADCPPQPLGREIFHSMREAMDLRRYFTETGEHGVHVDFPRLREGIFFLMRNCRDAIALDETAQRYLDCMLHLHYHMDEFTQEIFSQIRPDNPLHERAAQLHIFRGRTPNATDISLLILSAAFFFDLRQEAGVGSRLSVSALRELQCSDKVAFAKIFAQIFSNGCVNFYDAIHGSGGSRRRQRHETSLPLSRHDEDDQKQVSPNLFAMENVRDLHAALVEILSNASEVDQVSEFLDHFNRLFAMLRDIFPEEAPFLPIPTGGMGEPSFTTQVMRRLKGTRRNADEDAPAGVFVHYVMMPQPTGPRQVLITAENLKDILDGVKNAWASAEASDWKDGCLRAPTPSEAKAIRKELKKLSCYESRQKRLSQHGGTICSTLQTLRDPIYVTQVAIDASTPMEIVQCWWREVQLAREALHKKTGVAEMPATFSVSGNTHSYSISTGFFGRYESAEHALASMQEGEIALFIDTNWKNMRKVGVQKKNGTFEMVGCRDGNFVQLTFEHGKYTFLCNDLRLYG